MTWLKAILFGIGLLALVLLGLLLGIDNHTAVSLRFLNKETPALAVFWWLYAAFLIGVFAGLGICVGGLFRARIGERRLKRQLAERDRELGTLRDEGRHAA